MFGIKKFTPMKYLPDSNRGIIDNFIPIYETFNFLIKSSDLLFVVEPLFLKVENHLLQCLSVRTTSTFMLCSSANVVTQSMELRWMHFHSMSSISNHMTVYSVQCRHKVGGFVRQVKFHFAESVSSFCLLRKTSNCFNSMFCDSDLLLISFPPRMQPFCMALEWYTSTITPFSGEYK